MAMLLIDSSWIIDALRQRQSFRRFLQPRLEAGRLATCGIVRLEVLRGIISLKAREEFAGWFGQMIEVPTDIIWPSAIDLAWSLSRRGIVLPLPDIIIAACALRVGAAIVSPDKHFSRIPGLTVYTTLP